LEDFWIGQGFAELLEVFFNAADFSQNLAVKEN